MADGSTPNNAGSAHVVRWSDLNDVDDILTEAVGCNQALHLIAMSTDHHPYIRSALTFCVIEMEKRLDALEELLAKMRGEKADA